MSGRYHVWLEQSAFQVDVVVAQCLVAGGKHLKSMRTLTVYNVLLIAPRLLPVARTVSKHFPYFFSDFLATLKSMVSIRKDFRLNDWHDTMLQDKFNL